MLKINNKLSEIGFSFDDIGDLYFYIYHSLDWLTRHNKNYTKEQYNRLNDIKDLLDCIECE